MLLFSGVSERVRILGKSLQLKVAQLVVAIFAVFILVQMHVVFCSAIQWNPFRKCLRGGFAFCDLSSPLSI